MDRNQSRDELRETMQLQKDAAALSEKLAKTVLGQQPLQEGEIEKIRMTSASGMSPRAGIQNLLLRIRVLRKTVEAIETDAAVLHEKCLLLQDRQSGLAVTAALLTQTQAEAQMIADSCRELEKALILAVRASGASQALQLQEAAARARKLFPAQEKR